MIRCARRWSLACFLLILAPVASAADGVGPWVAQSSGTSNDLRSVIYAQNKFVAVGDAETIVVSPDGEQWTQVHSGSLDLLGVTYFADPGLFIAFGRESLVLTSPDGESWTERYADRHYPDDALTSVLHANGVFVASGPGTTTVSSHDGETWEKTAYGAAGIAFGHGVFVIVGTYQKLRTSTDGFTWTDRWAFGTRTWWGNKLKLDQVASVRGLFATTASMTGRWTPAEEKRFPGYNAFTSANGLRWTRRKLPFVPQVLSVARNKFFAFRQYFWDTNTQIVSSLNGVRWKRVYATPDTNHLLTNFIDAGAFLIAVGRGIVVTSTDGNSWTASYVDPAATRWTPPFNGAAFGGGRIVVVGSGGAVLQSAPVAPAGGE